ncbi:hypothetical protein SEPCBS119000_003083 [Sporothrix epigloea]|uniref:Uncharacterized protein n=1 Tax=Sporothrix epigloea TaxID=1892477 RepID=A0ABP0DJQ2_9PEZI
MSGFSNVLKNGWHPEKGQDFKKQVTGIWKKDDSNYEARANHVSRPLTSLRDPASFGPPPRHVALGGGVSAGDSAALVHSSARPSASSVSKYTPAAPARPALPSRHQAAAASDEDEDRARSPPPYRMDTTGLSTSHLPPPPTRSGRSSVPASPAPASRPVPNSPAKAAPPTLPPRLPPRSTPSPSLPSVYSPPQPHPTHTYTGAGADQYINRDAVNRLGRAGVSVPGLGIGPAGGNGGQAQQQQTALSAINKLAASPGRTNSLVRATSPLAQHLPSRTPAASHAAPTGQIDELQARFANIGTAAGLASSHMPPRSPVRPAVGDGNAMASLVAGKKKPPPPPAKKPGLAAVTGKPYHGNTSNEDDDDCGPPPIPMATRPQGW